MLSSSNLQSKRTGLQPPANPVLDAKDVSSKKMPEEKQESPQTSPETVVAAKTVTTTDVIQTEAKVSEKPAEEGATTVDTVVTEGVKETLTTQDEANTAGMEVNTNNSSDIGSKSLVNAKDVVAEVEKTEETQKAVVDKVIEETARLSIEAKTNESKVGETVENATVSENTNEIAKDTVTEKDSVQPTDAQIQDKAQLVQEGQIQEAQSQIVEASKIANDENVNTQEDQSKIEGSKKRGIHEISKIDDPAKIDQNVDPKSETQDITKISTGSKKKKLEETLQNSSDQVVQNVPSSDAKHETTETILTTSNPQTTTKDKIESQSSKTVTNEAKPMEDEGAQVAQKQFEKTDDLEEAYFSSVNGDETKTKEDVQNPETTNDITTVQKGEMSTTMEVQKDDAPSTSMDCKI